MAGTSASDMHFQAYLLEGQSRWNVDREAAAVTSSLSPESKTYSDLLCQSVNKLSESVLGKKLKPHLKHIGKYTGRRIVQKDIAL